MDKEKRKICLILTAFGVIFIIIAQTIIMILDEAELKEENYIRTNIEQAARKCINDKACEEKDISVLDLIEKEYLDDYFIADMKDYSTSSYVEYPSFNINLKRKEDD